jgi:hypothetical protein
MSNKHNQDSFNKGQAFENYVEKVLFPDAAYELLHKTNPYGQNSDRYVGDSRNPDFRFKCRLTGSEFHVEAKYRTTSFNDSYGVLSETQVTTFPHIHTADVPIFIALGYGNTASNPEYVSLIPYSTDQEQSVPVETAFEHQIAKSEVASSLLISKLLKNR